MLDDLLWVETLTTDQIRNLFSASWEHGNTLRPIMRLQFFLDRTIYGAQPIAWHLTNLLFHNTISFIGYLILVKATGRKTLSFISATIFAISPSNHEVVAWISGRTHAFGLLLSMLSSNFLYRFSSSHDWLAKDYINIVVGYTFLVLALLTYEVSFVIPAVLTLSLFFIESISKRFVSIVIVSWATLILLLLYRFKVLGGSMGSVGSHHTHIVLAPFLNFAEVASLFLYSKELLVVVLFVFLVFVYEYISGRNIKNSKKQEQLAIFCFLVSAITYLPFAIVDGVAPRYLYSAFFFFVLGGAITYAYLDTERSKTTHILLIPLVGVLLILSSYMTYDVANTYKEVGEIREEIVDQVKSDFPTWPEGKDMVFYGIPDTHKNVLAFITYFDKVIFRNYPNQKIGRVFRAEKLSIKDSRRILGRGPIIYRYHGVGKGIVLE